MKINDVENYGFENKAHDFARMLNVVEHKNKNGTVELFYDLTDGFTIEGIEDIPYEDVIEYRCKNGDDLRFISYDFFGTTDMWWLIAKINGIEDCTEKLEVGRTLKILPESYMKYIYGQIRENI